jgi:hypothetical protein
MSRVGTAVVVLALTGLVGGCSGLDVFTAPRPSSGAPSASSSSAAPSSPIASSAAASTAAPSAAPTTVALAAPRPIAPPTSYSGAGNVVLTIAKPAGSSAVIASIAGNAGGHNFDVRAVDGAHDHLVATTAPYNGSTLLDAAGTTTHQLRVHAVGAWLIRLTDVRSAPSFTVGYRGSGDAVLLHVGPGGSGLVAAQGAGHSFVVRAYRAGRATAVVDETGPWSGNVRWPSGDAIVTVRAVGPWTITVDHR